MSSEFGLRSAEVSRTAGMPNALNGECARHRLYAFFSEGSARRQCRMAAEMPWRGLEPVTPNFVDTTQAMPFELLQRFPADRCSATSQFWCSILQQSCTPNYFRIPNS